MKSLIISAAVAVSTLFAGAALADEPARGAERPSVQNALRGRSVDASERTAMKIRERSEHNARSVSRIDRSAERHLDRFRSKGDMVGDKGKASRTETRGRTEQGARTSKMLQNKVDKRGDIEGRNPNQRRVTVANDRTNRNEHNGPRTIVDVMKRKEVLKFLGATGVKINCSQTGTCVEEAVM